MGVNFDKPCSWKDDISKSVDLYNSWFLDYAPQAFRETRILTSKKVECALLKTNYLKNISPKVLRDNPAVLSILRMSTCPPIARDRLIGLSGVSRNVVLSMEDKENPHVPLRTDELKLKKELEKLSAIISKMIDLDIFTWITEMRIPTKKEIFRASSIIADRLCGSIADPIIRNAQEERQLKAIREFLESIGYKLSGKASSYNEMKGGSFAFHMNIPVFINEINGSRVNIPIDVAIMPFNSKAGDLPIMIEAKSAGDFTNVNKRRKEESIKVQQLRNTFKTSISYNLFLCGYFDSGYLGYVAAEGIDWIWEHRINDLKKLGI